MKLSLFAYSRKGCETARRILALYPGAEKTAYAPQRLEEAGFEIPAPKAYAERFADSDLLVFVGSCGIAVRKIAPFVKDKTKDPAVLCVDELGSFVIALLSGHIGGANRAARWVADHLGATAVITTATDINGRFSPDAWAARQGFAIDSMKTAKAVSAAILEGDIPISTALPVTGDYPPGTYGGNTGKIGIQIGWEKENPFGTTLHLIPKGLHLGIGCRKGISREAVARAVDAVLDEYGIFPQAIACAGSIDLKAGEEGLLEFCRERQLPIHFYTPGELLAVPGSFTPSAFVQSVTGVDNVCERAALLGADRLIVKKTAREGVTVALAAEKLEVSFG